MLQRYKHETVHFAKGCPVQETDGGILELLTFNKVSLRRAIQNFLSLNHEHVFLGVYPLRTVKQEAAWLLHCGERKTHMCSKGSTATPCCVPC